MIEKGRLKTLGLSMLRFQTTFLSCAEDVADDLTLITLSPRFKHQL
jgi:hypothetical protein